MYLVAVGWVPVGCRWGGASDYTKLLLKEGPASLGFSWEGHSLGMIGSSIPFSCQKAYESYVG